MNLRTWWLPKLPELSEQCASCPFREGNDDAWRAVVTKLRAKFGLAGRVTAELLRCARLMARRDLQFTGDFACHHTAYNADGNLRPTSEHRQCPGASKLFRAAGERP